MSRTALVVDDDPLTRQAVVRVLRKLGVDTILQADNVTRGMRLLGEHPPALDLVVMDQHMPGGEGVDTLPALRRHAPDAPILFFSGAEPPSSLLPALERNECHWLQKPVSATCFSQIVGQLLAGASPA